MPSASIVWRRNRTAVARYITGTRLVDGAQAGRLVAVHVVANEVKPTVAAGLATIPELAHLVSLVEDAREVLYIAIVTVDVAHRGAHLGAAMVNSLADHLKFRRGKIALSPRPYFEPNELLRTKPSTIDRRAAQLRSYWSRHGFVPDPNGVDLWSRPADKEDPYLF